MGSVAIISVVIIAGVILFIGGYFGTNYFFKYAEVQRENTYCENWYNSIENRRIQLENQIAEYNNAGFWEQLSTDADYLNSQAAALDQEGREYNKECAY